MYAETRTPMYNPAEFFINRNKGLIRRRMMVLDGEVDKARECARYLRENGRKGCMGYYRKAFVNAKECLNKSFGYSFIV